MPRARRQMVRSSDNLELDAFAIAESERELVPGLASPAVQLTPPLPPLAAFAVLFRAGFLTPLGCVCARPLFLASGEPTLAVQIDRLKIAARALQTPLRKAEEQMLLDAASRPEACPLGTEWKCLTPSIVRAQWMQQNACHVPASADERRFFAQQFRRLVASTKAVRGPLVDDSWARPVALEEVNEEALEALCANLDISYRPGREWSFGWRCLPVSRRPALLVSYDEVHAKAKVGERIFVEEAAVPGPLLQFEGPDNPCCGLRAAALFLLSEKTLSQPPPAEEVERLISILGVDGRLCRV